MRTCRRGYTTLLPGRSVAQSLRGQDGGDDTQGYGGEEEPAEADEAPADPPSRADSAWKRYILGLDGAQEPAKPEKNAPTGEGPSSLVVPRREGGPVPELPTESLRSDVIEAVDQTDQIGANTGW